MECRKDQNMEFCSCTYPSCARKGICCECVLYHRKKRQLPGCFFNPEAEKTYDRSYEYFAELVNRKEL